MNRLGGTASTISFLAGMVLVAVAVYKSGHYQQHWRKDVSLRRLRLGSEDSRHSAQRWRKMQNRKKGGRKNKNNGVGTDWNPNSYSGPHRKWKVNDGDRSGLTLQVLNNLIPGSDWNKYLDTSFREWANGTPNTVRLNLHTVPYDPECNAQAWAIKVCNGNYGKTEWKGLNRIFMKGDSIVASVTKMNDYYLEKMDKEEKLYSVCHELGHGLGLVHSDENFDNQDLGNCMDYTHAHHNNMHPGRINFKALKEIYGTKRQIDNFNWMLYDGGRKLKDTDHVDSNMLQSDIDRYSTYSVDSPSDYLFDGADDAASWRILHKTGYVQIHERQLENGYSIRTSVLMA